MPTLDGLRFVAVVMTSAVHLAPSAVPGGFLGVDIFFVLSGFLITVLLLGAADRSGRIPLRQFYSRRLRRLVPAVAALMAVFVIWTLASGPSTRELKVAAVVVASVAGYVFNWAGVLGHDPPWQVDHLWSLSVEEQFYLLWPFALMFLIRRFSPRTVMIVTAGAAFASAAAQVGAWLISHDVGVVYLASPLRAEGILLGCLLAQLFVWDVGQGTLGRIARSRTPWLLACLVLAALTMTLGVDSPLTYEGGMAVADLAAAVVVATLVAKEAFGLVGPVVRRLLANRVVAGLGRRSYSIYLWQNPVAWALTPTIRHSWLWLPVNAAITLACAQLSYTLVERPFLRGRRRSAAG